MPTQTWMYFGNRALLDGTATTNATATQAGRAVGWSATGSDQLAPTDTTGTPLRSGQGYNTTYQNGDGGVATGNFSYTNPLTGTNVSGQQIQSFLSASFDVKVPDYAGGGTLAKNGVLIQMRNGDVFFRPSSSEIESWDDIPAIESVTVTSAAVINSYVAAVGFNPSIYDIPLPCFVRGTMIQTDNGPVAIEDLKVGDMVATPDRGLQAITWIGRAMVTPDALTAIPRLRPIRIAKNALGDQQPQADLLVSPHHRVLVRSKIAQRMFNTDEVLVPAKKLTAIEGIQTDTDMAQVEYFHFLLDQHSIVIANGAETETMYTGPEALKAVSPHARREILELFPELATVDYQPSPARPIQDGRRARKLASRHAMNDVKPVC